MAEDPNSGQDKTEEATQERRDEFRSKGQVAISRDLSSVFVLFSTTILLALYLPNTIQSLLDSFRKIFSSISFQRINQTNILGIATDLWTLFLKVIIPFFLVSLVSALLITFGQTRLNWSWKRLAPDFKRLDIIKGLGRMVSGGAAMELIKGILKLAGVSLVSYLILKSEWLVVPGLGDLSVRGSWSYWGDITFQLFVCTSGCLLLVAGVDYTYQYIRNENQLKMTKQEVKEDYKKRELDPLVKNRMRRMQRDISTRKMLASTETATVVITNPTHFSIALKYEVGMSHPIVVAKGIDYIALRIREVAKDFDVPIVENPPLARTLYKLVEVDQGIPETLYKAIAEIIRYVYKIKGIKIKNT